tara:strand:- start:54 stop:608 length:555 start_codon:yes stop_codon:yes gene_type:complete
MIDKYAELVSLIGHNLIRGIFISVILLIIVKMLFKRKLETEISLRIIKWIIIIYSFAALTSYSLLFIFPHEEKYAFLERANGPYSWAYWLMLFANCIIPLILLNKRIGKNIYIILCITIFMNIGWVFESFVIHMTSMHRDYISDNFNPYLPSKGETRILIQGFVIGLISLLIGNGIQKWRIKTE